MLCNIARLTLPNCFRECLAYALSRVFVAGDYDVVIPQDIQAAMYSIRVGLFSDDSVFGCSGTFSVVSDPSLYLPSSQDSMSYTFEYEEDFGRDGDWWRASDFEGPATSLFDDDYVDSLVGDLSYAFSYDN